MTSMIENKELNEMINEATAQIELLKVLNNRWDELLKRNSYKFNSLDYTTYSNHIYYGINAINTAKFDLSKFIEMLKQDFEYNEYMVNKTYSEKKN